MASLNCHRPTGATSIDDAAFLVAARALAAQVPPALLAQGTLFPPLDDIREVSLNIAVAVARHFYGTVLRPAVGVATRALSLPNHATP